jgi:hypothetical protein
MFHWEHTRVSASLREMCPGAPDGSFVGMGTSASKENLSVGGFVDQKPVGLELDPRYGPTKIYRSAPESAFERPLDIVDEKLLTKGEKLAALERWQQSILEQLKATSEGMPTGGVSAGHMEALEEIEETKRRLA